MPQATSVGLLPAWLPCTVTRLDSAGSFIGARVLIWGAPNSRGFLTCPDFFSRVRIALQATVLNGCDAWRYLPQGVPCER